jgi:hypothetical protein
VHAPLSQVRKRAVLVRALSCLQRGVAAAQQHRAWRQWRTVCTQAAATAAAAKALALRNSTAGNQSTLFNTHVVVAAKWALYESTSPINTVSSFAAVCALQCAAESRVHSGLFCAITACC